MLTLAAAGPINHVLRGESWALRRLQPFAGCVAKFDIPPLSLSFAIRESGELAPAAPGAAPDATFRLSPLTAARLVAGDPAARREVVLSGHTELAQAIDDIVANIRWDLEEDLARVFGDVIAHRIAGAGRELVRWQGHAARSLTRNLADYLVEERPLIARRDDVERFVGAVDDLRDDVERLAARIDRLTR